MSGRARDRGSKGWRIKIEGWYAMQEQWWVGFDEVNAGGKAEEGCPALVNLLSY